MLSEAIAFFRDNQFASGMLASTALAGGAYVLRSIPAKLWKASLWFFSVEVAVRNYDDTSFDAINRWLAPHCKHRFVKNLVLSSEERDEDYGDDSYHLDIGEGVHFALYQGRPIVVHRYVHSERSMLYKQSEEIVVRFWFRNRDFVQSLIDDIKQASNKHDGIGVRHWTHESWCAPIYKKRPLGTVVLPEGQLEDIVADMQRFIDGREWYGERGLPYRRGYLFRGHPGCGKTSLIMALATHFRRPICILSVGTLTSDLDLIAAVHSAPKDAIIAIEDIDACMSSHDRKRTPDYLKKQKQGENTGVSLSGLLNALDGIGTPDGRIFVLSTNYPEMLDDALVRPGRVDYQLAFTPLDFKDQERLFRLQYGDGVPYVGDPGIKLTPAQMQQAFLENPLAPASAMQRLLAA
jgi:mitochondrial chaperone BCS1